eukprot:jgi/Chrpa1/21488/Chrysochromulina_OHIO_Genome00021714-RA
MDSTADGFGPGVCTDLGTVAPGATLALSITGAATVCSVKRAYGLEPLVRVPHNDATLLFFARGVIDAEGQRVHRALLVYLPLVSIPHGSTHQRVPKIIPIVAPEDDSIWDVMFLPSPSMSLFAEFRQRSAEALEAASSASRKRKHDGGDGVDSDETEAEGG